LARAEETVVVSGTRCGRRGQRKGRLRLALEVAREQAVRGERDDPVLAEIRGANFALGRCGAEHHAVGTRAERLRHLPELTRCLGQPGQASEDLQVCCRPVPTECGRRNTSPLASRSAAERRIAEPYEGQGGGRPTHGGSEVLER